MESWKKPGAPKIPENIQKAAEALSKQVEEIHGRFVAPPPEFLGNAGPPLAYTPPPFSQRVNRLMGAIEGYSAAPTRSKPRNWARFHGCWAKPASGSGSWWTKTWRP